MSDLELISYRSSYYDDMANERSIRWRFDFGNIAISRPKPAALISPMQAPSGQVIVMLERLSPYAEIERMFSHIMLWDADRDPGDEQP